MPMTVETYSKAYWFEFSCDCGIIRDVKLKSSFI